MSVPLVFPLLRVCKPHDVRLDRWHRIAGACRQPEREAAKTFLARLHSRRRKVMESVTGKVKLYAKCAKAINGYLPHLLSLVRFLLVPLVAHHFQKNISSRAKSFVEFNWSSGLAGFNKRGTLLQKRKQRLTLANIDFEIIMMNWLLGMCILNTARDIADSPNRLSSEAVSLVLPTDAEVRRSTRSVPSERDVAGHLMGGGGGGASVEVGAPAQGPSGSDSGASGGSHSRRRRDGSGSERGERERGGGVSSSSVGSMVDGTDLSEGERQDQDGSGSGSGTLSVGSSGSGSDISEMEDVSSSSYGHGHGHERHGHGHSRRRSTHRHSGNQSSGPGRGQRDAENPLEKVVKLCRSAAGVFSYLSTNLLPSFFGDDESEEEGNGAEEDEISPGRKLRMQCEFFPELFPAAAYALRAYATSCAHSARLRLLLDSDGSRQLETPRLVGRVAVCIFHDMDECFDVLLKLNEDLMRSGKQGIEIHRSLRLHLAEFRVAYRAQALYHLSMHHYNHDEIGVCCGYVSIALKQIVEVLYFKHLRNNHVKSFIPLIEAIAALDSKYNQENRLFFARRVVEIVPEMVPRGKRLIPVKTYSFPLPTCNFRAYM